ncbi:MAG: hypothetical protein PHY62_03090 [Gallionella sp.]|nr:hypothetical protein [Gallionella sp.]
MAIATPLDDEDWLSLLDLSAIADPDDKYLECEYFLSVAANEANRECFRWQISAFFNAAYSYFETSALSAYFSFTDPETGEPVEDAQALDVLRKYVKIFRNEKKPNFVKTAGFNPITERLYELRKANTHHVPMSIMAAGPSLPEDFHFGNMIGKGTPVLAFCRDAMALIRAVQQELDA